MNTKLASLKLVALSGAVILVSLLIPINAFANSEFASEAASESSSQASTESASEAASESGAGEIYLPGAGNLGWWGPYGWGGWPAPIPPVVQTPVEVPVPVPVSVPNQDHNTILTPLFPATPARSVYGVASAPGRYGMARVIRRNSFARVYPRTYRSQLQRVYRRGRHINYRSGH